jgi:hypothetical protein
MPERPVWARLDDTRQVVEVTVHRGYQPDSIRARAGVPLRIILRREDDEACSERVVFSAPKIDRRLASTGVTPIDLPAQLPGQIRFTCGMGLYRGRIEIVDEPGPSVRTRLGEHAARFGAGVGPSVFLWIGSLILIALLAVLALTGKPILAVAGLVLIAGVVGRQWASGRSAHL